MYQLKTDETHWVERTFNENMERANERVTDIYDDHEGYYWIRAIGEDSRDEVLKVMDFPQGEEILTRLHTGEIESLEEAEQQYEYAEIREERPPQ